MNTPTFARYQNYKDTDIDWLEQSPSHWTIKRLKDIGTSTIGLTYSPDEIVEDGAEGVLVLRSSNI